MGNTFLKLTEKYQINSNRKNWSVIYRYAPHVFVSEVIDTF